MAATIEVFAVGGSKQQQLQHMTTQARNIVLLGVKSKRLGRVPQPEDGPHIAALLKEGRLHLQWLDTVEMTPEIKAKTKPDTMLKHMLDDPAFHYPEDMKKRALALRERWESENWGEDAVVIDEDVVAEDQELLSPVSATAAATEDASITEAQLPPQGHPIYGRRGIMNGIMIVRGASGRKTYRLNPEIPKRPAKVFGHNGIAPGTWFANQLVALHRGAHGARMGGISGSMNTGAHSIVVSDNYDDLDDDRGDTLYYSGSNSHSNTDPTRPAPSSSGTKALKASLATGNPVRVLRSGGPQSSKKNPWLPDCGLRYDGLYRVVALRVRTNTNGGLYEQFVLQREPGQASLDTLKRISPTKQQRVELAQIQLGY
ncbi:PUA-like domain-containing protein [Durotheca rogersii]|uniref:PUA-like domain-containing protein n=1 Tax=Durotheca rogersii TaxID=419775 RepID=UPI00221E4094|nr:PUA-like domain-containing protein [Durotheca rogersii]KAI5867476.1 PUA-like domain-containing protein [Durotheca rogersii]